LFHAGEADILGKFFQGLKWRRNGGRGFGVLITQATRTAVG